MAHPKTSSGLSFKLVLQRVPAVLLTGLLGLLLVQAMARLPKPSEIQPAQVHVSARFVENSSLETGHTNALIAVLGDYRSFALLATNFLFFAALVLFLSLSPVKSALSIFVAGFSVLASITLGFYCARNGSNFLDFEPLALLTGPQTARPLGSWTLVGLVAVCFLVLTATLFSALRSKEASHGR